MNAARFRVVAPALLLCCAGAALAAEPITLRVDATDAPRRIFHAALTIPTTGWGPGATDPATGDFLLYFPKWIPGEHGPTGPINDIAGLKFSIAGKPLSWRRDPVDMHAIHVSLPKGATSIDAALDYLSPADAEGFTAGANASANLAVISWNTLLLYPRGTKSDDVPFAPSLRLPAGWQFGTALELLGAPERHGDGVSFKPVSLTMLVDSPVNCGRYFAHIDLSPGQTPAHFLEIAADSPAALHLAGERLEAHKNLIPEALALYGARHYNAYHFLLTLSDSVAHFGLEHHQSSDDRTAERAFLDDKKWMTYSGLMPHEYTHSWCGKHRRPAGLATGDFETPMKGEMLWVYEGLTTYLGNVLTARAGFLDTEEWHDYLAFSAADLDHRTGRKWRNLLDTADAAQDLYNTRGGAWSSWRRGTDFYAESELIWLEADTLIREKTAGAKCLDDFCRLFLAAPGAAPGVAEGKADPSGRAPTVLPYSFDDVIAALSQVCPYDWKTFLTDRLTQTGDHAPLAGLTNSGWKIAYTDEPNFFENERDEDEHETLDLRFGLGVKLTDEGAIDDALPGSPAFAAGLAPGLKIVAVNSLKYSHDRMRDALAAAHDAPKGAGVIEVILDNAGTFSVAKIDYAGGALHPHLVRDEAHPDLLSQIIAPKTRAAPKATPEKKKG